MNHNYHPHCGEKIPSVGWRENLTDWRPVKRKSLVGAYLTAHYNLTSQEVDSMRTRILDEAGPDYESSSMGWPSQYTRKEIIGRRREDIAIALGAAGVELLECYDRAIDANRTAMYMLRDEHNRVVKIEEEIQSSPL